MTSPSTILYDSPQSTTILLNHHLLIRIISLSTVVLDPKAFLQPQGDRLLQAGHGTQERNASERDDRPEHDDRNAEGQHHQRTADDPDRWLDQLDVLRLRDHSRAVSAHAEVQGHAAARRRTDEPGRQLGLVRKLVLLERVRTAKHLHACAR